jgi:glycosyltransferase involved in cell wall biosynthesis
MRYLLLVPAGARRLSPGTFAIESAFAEHLRELRGELAPRFTEIVVAMSGLDAASYETVKRGYSEIDEAAEGIRLESLYPMQASKLDFAIRAPSIAAHITRLVQESGFVHSHLSHDLYRPIGAIACAAAVALKKPCISVTDIDNRRDAEMNYKLRIWSRRVYLVCKYLYDPLRSRMQHAYVKHLDMVLFKEVQQVEDFGRGAPHVRFFLDPNFSEDQVLDDAAVEARVAALSQERPLRVLYFGRFVTYKGVDKMLQAVASARAQGAKLRFDLMGDGPERPALEASVAQLGLSDVVSFIAPRPYGESFFKVLHEHDILLACPLTGDTPRSTWDALASGMPVLAFDTPFYKSMGAFTGAVAVTSWPEVEPFAQQLLAFAKDKTQLAPRIRAGVKAARENSGGAWLKRRVAWVEELMTKYYGPIRNSPGAPVQGQLRA